MGGFWPILCFGGGLLGSHVVFRCKGDENQIGRYFQDAPKNRTPVLLLFPRPMTFKKGCFPWGGWLLLSGGGPTQSGFCLKVLGLKFPLTKRCKLWHFLGIHPRPPTRIATPDGVGFVQKWERMRHPLDVLTTRPLPLQGQHWHWHYFGISKDNSFSFFTWSHTDCTTHHSRKGLG